MGLKVRWSDWWDEARNVLAQLVREMGFPFVIASAWTTYSLVATPEKRNVVDAITVFFGSFFVTCWAFAQWFRVKKQQAVESGIGGIVKKQEALVATLMEATERLEGVASGGKGVAWLMLTDPVQGAIGNITAHVAGDYPIQDAHARVLDVAKANLGVEAVRLSGNIHDLFRHQVTFACGTLQPDLAILQNQIVPCDTTKDLIRFRIDWTARNGRWTQYVELKRSGTGYISYTAVQRGEEWVYENPARDDIPKRPDGKPDVFWHTGISQAFQEAKA